MAIILHISSLLPNTFALIDLVSFNPGMFFSWWQIPFSSFTLCFWCVAPWSANRRFGEMGAGEQNGCRRAQRGDFGDEWRLGFKVIEKRYTDKVYGEHWEKAVGHVLQLWAEKRGHLVAILAMMEWQVAPQHLRLRESEEVIQSLCTPGWSLWSFQHLSIQMT